MASIGLEQAQVIYKWPRLNLDDDVKYVLSGRLAEVPQKRSKVVRIFLSSTFTDTYVERNTLMQKIFPMLKLYCQDEYGLDFQVVDMRWGVQDEASDDHSAAELCMRELNTCQRLSVGPTFVGKRYGSRPIPVRIPEKELNLILAALEAHGETDDIPCLKKWFRLDENAVPSEYILQSLTAIGKAITEGAVSQEEKLMWKTWLREGRSEWRDAEPRLAASLRRGATHCIKEGTLTRNDAHVFTRSVTDEEIENGILKDEKRNLRSLCFVRKLKDINFKHPKAHRFIDQLSDGSLDEDAQQLLNELKLDKIPKCLYKENIFYFETNWSDNDGVNAEDHKEYVGNFCGTIEKEIKKLVEVGVKNSTKVTGDLLYDEVLEHAHQAVAKCERFHGRLDILEDIKNYIMSDNRKPLVIHGESGCGKTSIMAKAALMMPGWLGDNADLHIILRFLGTTPFSSTISNTMLSVTTQLHRTVIGAGRDFELPQNFIDIKDFFISTLDSLQKNELKNKRVVLVLDSLDQLSAVHGAHALGWLPTELPSNVKLIVSTLPQEHKILDTLRSLKLGKEQFVAVNALNKEDCLSILQLWLTQLSRKITTEQQALVDQVISTSEVRPLYLKLLFDEILSWRSFQPNEDLPTLQPDIEKSILQLFDRLERKHGAKLVQRAFGYLTASKNGLTELEMEDLLSLDDEVLDSVFEFHLPPIRRLPSILWARIRGDISEYIVDREADGARVMAWYHRQFIEKANRYFKKESGYGARGVSHTKKNKEDAESISSTLYEYFVGKWAHGRKKPFKYTEKQIKKYNFTATHSEAERFVSQQPSIFRRFDGSIDLENVRFNNRKVSELPNAIDQISRFWKTKDFITESVLSTLFDWEFLTAWCECATWAEISASLDSKDKTSTPADLKKEVMLMRSVFLLCVTTIYNNPFTLGPHIAGRMLPYYGTMEAFSHLIDGIEADGRHTCALVAPHYNLETPGGAMLYVINNHSSAVRDSQMLGMGLASVSDKLVYVSLEQGEVITDIRPRTMPDGDNFGLLALTLDKTRPAGGNHPWSHLGHIIGCASLQQRPWLYIMECTSGQVRETIRIEEVYEGKFPQITGLLAVDKYLLVTSSSSPTILVFNAFDGSSFGRIEGDANVVDARITVFNDIGYLLVIREPNGIVADFYKIGKVRVQDDSSDDSITMELIEDGDNVAGFDDGQPGQPKLKQAWYKNRPHRVSLGNRKMTSLSVSDSFTFAPMAFSDGTITYFLSHPPDEDIISSDDSEDSDADSGDEFGFSNARRQAMQYKMRPKALRKITAVKEIGAKMNTVSVDYFPIHSISCLRTSVYEEMLLTVSCTEHMLVVNEMLEGRSILRVRKHYTDARVSGKCKFLIAFDGGDIDIFRLFLEIPGLVHHSSIDAHSRPIQKLGILSDDFMFFSTSLDGSLSKFWNTEKLQENTSPKFDRAKDVVDCVCYAGSTPENMLAVSYYPPSSNKEIRSLDIWHVLDGRRIETIKSLKPVLAATAYNKSGTEVSLITLVSNGDLLIWNISDLFNEPMATPHGRLPSKKSLMESMPVDVKASLLCEHKSGVLYLVLNTGEFVIYGLKDQCIRCKSSFQVTNLKCPFLGTDGYIACFSADSRCTLHVRNQHGKAVGVNDEIVKGEIADRSEGGKSFLLKMNDTEIEVLDGKSRSTVLSRSVARSGEVWKNNILAITPDGCYILAAWDRELRLLRVTDGRQIAWVTLYDTICSVNITPDSWFVILGMPDRRFFVLLISDPGNKEHDQRIATARKHDTGIDKGKAEAIAELALKQEAYDRSDEEPDAAALGLNIVTLLDMENEGNVKRSLSRNASTMSRIASRMTTHSDQSSGEEGESEGQSHAGLVVMSHQLCTLQ